MNFRIHGHLECHRALMLEQLITSVILTHECLKSPANGLIWQFIHRAII